MEHRSKKRERIRKAVGKVIKKKNCKINEKTLTIGIRKQHSHDELHHQSMGKYDHRQHVLSDWLTELEQRFQLGDVDTDKGKITWCQC